MPLLEICVLSCLVSVLQAEVSLDVIKLNSQNEFKEDLSSSHSNILKLKFIVTKGSEQNKNFHFNKGFYRIQITRELNSASSITEQGLTIEAEEMSKKDILNSVKLNIYHKVVFIILDTESYSKIKFNYELFFENTHEMVIQREFVDKITFEQIEEISELPEQDSSSKDNELHFNYQFINSIYVINLKNKSTPKLKLPGFVFQTGTHARVYLNSCNSGSKVFFEWPEGLNSRDFRCRGMRIVKGSDCLFFDNTNGSGGSSVKNLEIGLNFLSMFSDLVIMFGSEKVKQGTLNIIF